MSFFSDQQHLVAVENFKLKELRCKGCTELLTYDQRLNTYCSHSCSAKDLNKLRIVTTKCLRCEGDTTSTFNMYCSKECRSVYNYERYVSRWKDGLETGTNKYEISAYLIKYIKNLKGEKCWVCGWNEVNPATNKIPVEIDHIDGNSQNNVEQNLRLLCPNCHSLTPTYRALNKGNGRGHRRKLKGLIV